MLVNRAFKVRLYPNDKQRKLIDRTFGCARKVYNALLADRKDTYERLRKECIQNPNEYQRLQDELSTLYKSTQSGKKPLIKEKWKEIREFEKANLDKAALKEKLKIAAKSYKTWKQIKDESVNDSGEKYMYAVDSLALSAASQNLQTAFTNFYNGIGGRRKGQSGYPKFKSKTGNASYTTYQQQQSFSDIIDIGNKTIKIAKLGKIKFVGNIPDLSGLVMWNKAWSETVSRDAAGHYFVSILLDFDVVEVAPKPIDCDSKIIGLDMALEKCYVDSDGNSPDFTGHYRANEKKLKRIGKLLSHKLGSKKGEEKSRRFKKLQKTIARTQFHIQKSRREFVELETNRLIENNDVIAIENLTMRGMANKKAHHGKSVADVSWGLFTNRLTQKMQNSGKILHKVGRFFPSSKQCRFCGNKNDNLKLKDRKWKCPHCGAMIENRDHNAALNIKEEATRELAGLTCSPVLLKNR